VTRTTLAVAGLLGLLAAPPASADISELGRITLPAGMKAFFLRVSPDGRQLTAVESDAKLHVWSLPERGAAARELRVLDVDGTGISTLAYSFDGAWIAAGTPKGVVAVFDARTGRSAARFTATTRVTNLAVSPRGDRVAVGSAEGSPTLWDVLHSRQLAVLKTGFGASNAFDFSPDGSRLASADEDTAIRIYDPAGGLAATIDQLPLETFALSFTPDGRQLLAGGADKRVSVIDVSTWHVARQLPAQPDSIAWLVARRTGRAAVTGSFKDESMDLPGSTLAWTLDGDAPHQIVAGQRFNGGGALADGRLLLTTPADGAIVLWSVR
jgi:WD40 repeat protein